MKTIQRSYYIHGFNQTFIRLLAIEAYQSMYYGILCLAINVRLYFSLLSYLSNDMNSGTRCPNMCSHSNFKFDLLTSSLKWHISKKRPLYNSAFFRPFSISKFVIHCVLKHKNVFTLYKLLMLLMPKGKQLVTILQRNVFYNPMRGQMKGYFKKVLPFSRSFY